MCLHWTHVSSRAGSGMRRHWDPWLQCNGPMESRSHPLTRLCFYFKYQALFPLHLLLSETLCLSTAVVIIVISFDKKKMGECKEENKEMLAYSTGARKSRRREGGRRQESWTLQNEELSFSKAGGVGAKGRRSWDCGDLSPGRGH